MILEAVDEVAVFGLSGDRTDREKRRERRDDERGERASTVTHGRGFDDRRNIRPS
ncbi:hypothetical protein [Natrinema saccharevitans]|uniref:hypothetical protein n=1 Tax=Natrinema saccharevitans TaxID=301967 RepID=UPI001FE536D9|nr:hypothetical protein [Natrinema saccharevitans]